MLGFIFQLIEDYRSLRILHKKPLLRMWETRWVELSKYKFWVEYFLKVIIKWHMYLVALEVLKIYFLLREIDLTKWLKSLYPKIYSLNTSTKG